MVCQVAYTATAGVAALTTVAAPIQPAHQLMAMQSVPAAIATVAAPSFEEKPDWYQKQAAEEKTSSPQQQATQTTPTSGRVVTYTISTKGATSSDLGEFSAQVNQTLNDSRGWARLGVTFQEVASGGQFNLILSEAALVPSFSAGCDTEYSCRVGISVIINDVRWSTGSPAWNESGASLRDYRHMVLNHEVGHWLGHGHLSCPAGGSAAPLMQQQSISLQGCTANAWPLESELWSSQLGIQ